MCFLAKISLHRPTCKTTFARLTQSQAISQSFRVFITFRSETRLFFIFRNTFFCTKYRFLYHGDHDQQISWWRICRWRAVNLEIHLWSSWVTAFGDRPASSMSKFSASVNSHLWVWSYQLTSDLREVYFLDMHTCLAMVVSESSFGVYLCLWTPAGLHRNQRSCVQRLTLQWITFSTLLMMAHKAETALQGWSVDPMEDVILTHQVLAARSTVRLFESLTIGKSFSLVLCLLVVMVTAQASVVILLNLHPQARGWA